MTDVTGVKVALWENTENNDRWRSYRYECSIREKIADSERRSVLDYLERLVGVSVEIDMKMLLCYTFR